MSLLGLALSLLLFALAIALVTRPFWTSHGAPVTDRDKLRRQREILGEYYERVLTNIRDLDEDHLTGKIPQGDYQAERELWVGRGIQALKARAGLERQISQEDAGRPQAERVDQAIEAAIAAWRDGERAASPDRAPGRTSPS